MQILPCAGRQILNSCDLDNFEYQVDPYIGCGHYCYYCYVLGQAETDWRKEILFHEDIAARLAEELSSIPPQTIYMGWHTDPYQPCEADCRQTRQVLEVLARKGFSVSILTKSDLVIRDLDILTTMPNASVSVSVAFTDEAIREHFEADTKETKARISALRKIKSAGVETATLICPIVPYLTDVNPLIEQLDDCAERIWVYGLSIPDKNEPSWQNVAQILDRHYPELKDRVADAVFSKDHPFWNDLRKELEVRQENLKAELLIRI